MEEAKNRSISSTTTDILCYTAVHDFVLAAGGNRSRASGNYGEWNSRCSPSHWSAFEEGGEKRKKQFLFFPLCTITNWMQFGGMGGGVGGRRLRERKGRKERKVKGFWSHVLP